MPERYDVAVIGAGPGGSAAAYFLARRGLGVVLIDKSEFPRDKTCGDGLTPRALGVLHEIGVFGDLLAAGQRVNGVEIYAPDGFCTTAPVPRREGLPVPMLIVPRITLDDVIRRRALQSGARFEGDVTVTDVQRAGRGVAVKGTRMGRPLALTARTAIAATGASTGLLRRLGLMPQAPRVMLAARAYFEGGTAPPDRIQIRFDGVPLPGYGWVFPLPSNAANVGVGYFAAGLKRRSRPRTARAAFEAFVTRGVLAAQLGRARRGSAVKSYPLRVDFPDAPTSGDGVILVGEAAGLVNPLTGEGIDYALESAQIAADLVAGQLARGDAPPARALAYDRELRARFERLFTFCRRVRDASLNTLLLNRLVRVAARRDDLKMLLVDLVLGSRDVSADLSARSMVQKAFTLIRSPRS